MSSINISWLVSDDAGFRELYNSVVGERVQKTPAISVDGLHYMVGSSRITQQHIDQLAAAFQISWGGGVDVGLFTWDDGGVVDG